MLSPELVARGQHVMTVCNACRYCEGYCPVFQAMEKRQTFAATDLAYLANLCHNCGECLYACQYAPPHEFGINVPRTLAEIRLATYEEACWPAAARPIFTRQRLAAAVLLVLGAVATLLAAARGSGAPHGADFYAVIPHDVMVGVFGLAGLFAAAALLAARQRFSRRFGQFEVPARAPQAVVIATATSDALTLRHLHDAGDCTNREEARGPWRRWFHHCTFYGFALCFLSTTIAAIYHVVLGWRAPYSYTSLPVVFGTLGGVGLIAGPIGLLAQRQQRDPALGDPAQRPLDSTLLAMLLLTSGTGLLLLLLRESGLMPGLLVVHLAVVFALFLMLPYGKFVHGLHRLAALARFAAEHQEGG